MHVSASYLVMHCTHWRSLGGNGTSDEENSFANFDRDQPTCEGKGDGTGLLSPSAQADDRLQLRRQAAMNVCSFCVVSVKSICCQIAVLVVFHYCCIRAHFYPI